MPESNSSILPEEAIAVYLQKYIQFRKRKVFYGPNGKDKELTDLLAKHITKEKFLLPSNASPGCHPAFLEERRPIFQKPSCMKRDLLT